MDAAAKALNLTTDQLREKLSDGKTTIADVAKQQNVDVDVVIDAMTNADKARMSEIVNNPWPKFGPAPGKGVGPAGPAGIPGIRGALGHMGSVALDSVAKALGITTDELKTDLAKGQSIADIAKAKNLDLDKVIDSLVADADAKLDQAVKDGHLTQEQADKLKAGIKTMITNLVNNGLPKGLHRGGFGFGGHKGFGGRTGGGPNTGVTTPTTKPPTS